MLVVKTRIPSIPLFHQFCEMLSGPGGESSFLLCDFILSVNSEWETDVHTLATSHQS